MRAVRITTRIKLGRIITIPPIIRRRLQLAVGDQVDCRVTGRGRIEVTKVLTPIEQRIQKLRKRLGSACQKKSFVLRLTKIPNVGEDDDFARS